MRTLPAFDLDDTDGCSLAPYLPARLRSAFQRKIINLIARGTAQGYALHAACVIHDMLYYYGGTKVQRKEADQLVRELWRIAGAPWWFYTLGYRSIRIFGRPSTRMEGISWAYGGSFFKYGVQAESQEEIVPSEQAQSPPLGYEGHDLWPFDEPRCNCDNDVVCSVLTSNGKPSGMVCEGCGKEYTERTL